MLAAGLRPTIFDKRPHVGGLWAPPLSGAVNLKPAMKTNASNFVTSFSDLPWDRSGKSNYPTVVEVGAYLEDYRKAYIPHDCLKLGCEIVGVSRADEAASWHVKWQAREGAAQEDFEFLVVASGFFAQAHTPDVGDLGGVKESGPFSKYCTGWCRDVADGYHYLLLKFRVMLASSVSADAPIPYPHMAMILRSSFLSICDQLDRANTPVDRPLVRV